MIEIPTHGSDFEPFPMSWYKIFVSTITAVWKSPRLEGLTKQRHNKLPETKQLGDKAMLWRSNSIQRSRSEKHPKVIFFHPKKRHKLDSFFCNSCGSIIDFLRFCWKGISLRIFFVVSPQPPWCFSREDGDSCVAFASEPLEELLARFAEGADGALVPLAEKVRIWQWWESLRAKKMQWIVSGFFWFLFWN